MDEDIKKILNEVIQHVDDKAVETRRHFEVIGESLQHEIRQVAEGVLANTRQINVLQADMDMVKETVGEIKVEITIIKEDVSVLKEDVSVLKEDVSVLKEDVSVLKQDVSVLKDDMKIVKEDIGQIKTDLSQKPSKQEFILLETRVTDLETKT